MTEMLLKGHNHNLIHPLLITTEKGALSNIKENKCQVHRLPYSTFSLEPKADKI